MCAGSVCVEALRFLLLPVSAVLLALLSLLLLTESRLAVWPPALLRLVVWPRILLQVPSSETRRCRIEELILAGPVAARV